MKPSPQKEAPKRRLSPEKFEKKKGNVHLDIADVEFVEETDPSVDETG